jgi:hypothetical protein
MSKATKPIVYKCGKKLNPPKKIKKASGGSDGK